MSSTPWWRLPQRWGEPCGMAQGRRVMERGWEAQTPIEAAFGAGALHPVACVRQLRPRPHCGLWDEGIPAQRRLALSSPGAS